MNYNPSCPKRTKKQGKKINKKQCWVIPGNPFKLFHPQEGAIRFDSTLEAGVYIYLNRAGEVVIPQHKVPMPDGSYWKADFYLPLKEVLLEVKGQWINTTPYRLERKLFTLQWAFASNQFKQAYVVGSEDFLINQTQVQNYRTLEL